MTAVDPQLVSGLGAAASVFLASTGSALASAHGGIFAIRRGQKGKDWKFFVPIVQAGVLSIYGLIVAILVVGKLGGGEDQEGITTMTASDGYRYLAAGLANGLGCWASGWGMAKFISMLNNEQPPPPQALTTVSTTTAAAGASLKAALESSQQEPLLGNKNSSSSIIATTNAPAADAEKAEFRQIICALIFLEAIGLYGFIVACVLIMKK